MPKSAAQCPFCEIIHGAAEVSLCYEDASALAFMDIQPVNPGHLLVVPREHYESLSDIPPHLNKHLFDVVTMLGPIVRDVSDRRHVERVALDAAEEEQRRSGSRISRLRKPRAK